MAQLRSNKIFESLCELEKHLNSLHILINSISALGQYFCSGPSNEKEPSPSQII